MGVKEGSDYRWMISEDLLKGVKLEQNLKDEEDSEKGEHSWGLACGNS